MENCKNCGHSISEEQKFCPECGQKNRDKLTFKDLMGELASAFLSWDSKFFRTIVPLITKPGHVSKEYLGGKRKSFVAPMRMYLFFSFIFFFTLSVLNSTDIQIATAGSEEDPDNIQETIQDDTVRMLIANEEFKMQIDELEELVEEDRLDEIPQIRDEQSAFYKKLWKKMLVVAADGGSFFGSYLQKSVSIMFFFFLPVFGLLIWVFFSGKKMDYIEHLIYGVNFHAFFFFILWLTLIISRLIGDGFPLLIGILYMVVYLIVGVKRFYEVKTSIAIVKSVFIALIYLILFIIFAFLTLMISVFLF
jgi:hypothetical protein